MFFIPFNELSKLTLPLKQGECVILIIMDVKEEMIALAEKLKIYQDTYYKEGKSLVSDSEYDRLTDRLIALE